MIQTKPFSQLTPRKKLLLKLLAFLTLAVLLYFRPRVEAWVESQKSTAGLPTSTTTPADHADSTVKSEDEIAAAHRRKMDTSDTDLKAKKSPEQSVNPVDPENRDAAKTTESKKTAGPAKKKSSVVKMDRTEPPPRKVPDGPEKSIPPPSASTLSKDKTASTGPPLGQLKELRNNVYESTAGLIYLPGSADGHRLRHVMKHAKDDPQKEIHGVFDGDRDEVLAAIDEAFTKAKKGGSDVRSEKQNDRRIYTINLRRRIGQMGGQQGERQGNPECRYLRIVLENDTEVISAYPTKSF